MSFSNEVQQSTFHTWLFLGFKRMGTRKEHLCASQHSLLFRPIYHSHLTWLLPLMMMWTYSPFFELDDLADFAHDVDFHAATARLATILQQMDQICIALRLRMTIQMVQLARRQSQHFQHHFRIPLVNLYFR